MRMLHARLYDDQFNRLIRSNLDDLNGADSYCARIVRVTFEISVLRA